MDRDWVKIFSGSFPKALALRASLEASGVRTRVPDEIMKVMDPFITGIDPLSVEILVPWDDVELAKEVMTSESASAAEDGAAQAGVDDAVRQGAPEPVDAEQLGRRVRWCFVLPIYGWLMGMAVGWRYLKASREARMLPDGHGVTLLIWAAQIVLLLGVVVLAASY
jgi:hypothetical protein